LGVSKPTFYRWKKQFVGMGVSEIRRLKQLEDENSKLERLVADLTPDHSLLQDVFERKW
jgi:putative transposase